MAIPIRTPDEMRRLEAAAASVTRVVERAAMFVRPGLRTIDLDAYIRTLIDAEGGVAILDGYTGGGSGPGFRGAACLCLNEEVVHAPPGDRIIRDADLLTIDVSLRLDGWCGDAAITLPMAKTGERRRRLAHAARRAVSAGTRASTCGTAWSSVARAVQKAAEADGVRLISGYCGHGIGRELHEPPRLPLAAGELERWLAERGDLVLRPGIVFTIEPIVTEGDARTIELDDGWTVVTADRSDTAHEERMLGISRSGTHNFTEALDRFAYPGGVAT